jgi:hypothetical protein
MDDLSRVFATHPAPASDAGREAHALVTAASACAAVCTACADACLAEEAVVDLRGCIRVCLDCADVCAVAARWVARPGKQDADTLRDLLALCARACLACAKSCAGHTGMAHCRACADACRACAGACDAMRDAIVD